MDEIARQQEFRETVISLLKHHDFKGAAEYLAKPRAQERRKFGWSGFTNPT